MHQVLAALVLLFSSCGFVMSSGGSQVSYSANQSYDNRIFVNNEGMPKSFNQFIAMQSADQRFADMYKTLSRSERNVLKKYYAQVCKLYFKASTQKMNWDDFSNEAIALLKPCEELAQKFAERNLFIFHTPVQTKFGVWYVAYDTQYPDGFGIVTRKEIDLFKDTPRDAEAVLSSWLQHETFANAYYSLTENEQTQLMTFIKDTFALYRKVDIGCFNHQEFQDEARSMLSAYQNLAQAFAQHNLTVIKVCVHMNGAALVVGYDRSFDNELKIMTRMTTGSRK